jgi:hypothetical protein
MVAEGVNRRSFARLAGEGTFQVRKIRNRVFLKIRNRTQSMVSDYK